MQLTNWSDISYLKTGNKRQQDSFYALTNLRILDILSEFKPLLVGTIPIGIDIKNSDLDIICYATDLEIFSAIIRNNFGKLDFFKDQMHHYSSNSGFYTASFIFEKIEFEIFAEPLPTYQQNGYRHMVVEDQILNIAGESFRHDVIRLKEEGYKTELAFGRLLQMKEPYSELLNLEKLTDEELRKIVKKQLESNN